MENTHTVSSYLIQKLHEYGIKHIFGVPGDYILGFYDELIRSNMLKVVNTCDEQWAAFAADAYARVKGFGAVCITYCVGGLKVVNATAQAYAEKSPVAVISGAPGAKERTKNPLLHHVVREYDTQQKIFEHITVASTVLNNPSTAQAEIDRVLSMAFRYKRPIYIELPRDMVSIPVNNVPNCMKVQYEERSDPLAMAEAVEEATAMINASRKPGYCCRGRDTTVWASRSSAAANREDRCSGRGHYLEQVCNKRELSVLPWLIRGSNGR
jgi:TPP-dependent 2-oxoacid decarboxylase